MRRPRGRSLVRSLALPAAVLTIAVPGLACSSDDAPGAPAPTEVPETTTTVDPGPIEGGTLTVASFTAPTALDPIVAPGGGATGGMEMAAIYDTLIRWDPTSATYLPRTALAVEPNGDASEWTIRIRPGVQFTDGTAYDAAAVKAGLDRHRSPVNRTPSAAHMARVRDVVVVDALTVVVSLTEVWPGFVAVLADEPGMIPSPTAVAACGATVPVECAFNIAPVGAGPFAVQSFAPGEELRLKPSSTHWNGRPYLDELRFVSEADSGGGRSLDALDRGEVDVAFLREAETVLDAKAAAVAGHPVVIEGGSVTLMNTGAWITCSGGQPAVHCTGRPDEQFRTSPPTSNLALRQAIAAALEPGAMDREVTGGAGRADTALLPEPYTGVPAVPGPVHDLAAAKASVDALKAAGWNGQLRYRCTNTPTNVARAGVIASQLAAAGIEAVLDVDGGTDEQVEALAQRDYDLACWGLQVTPDDLGADSLRQNLYSTLGTNRSGYENVEMDAALDALRVAPDVTAREAAYRRIAELYARDLPFYVDAAIEEYVAWADDVVGITPTLGSVVTFDQVWLKPLDR